MDPNLQAVLEVLRLGEMMENQHDNPFNITKAVDFTDQEINDYWIDIPESGGFQQLVKPTSPMPMFILGGKGSGKTHLMRYFSYPLQKIRHAGRVHRDVQDERSAIVVTLSHD